MKKEDFITKAREKHGDRYNYSLVPDEFSLKDKITIVCSLHGEYNQKSSNHIHLEQGCPHCGTELQRLNRRKSVERSFTDKVLKVHGDRYDISCSLYITQNTEIDVICKDHGKFKITPKSFLVGTGCNKCSRESMRNRFKMPYDTFIERFEEIYSVRLRILGDLNYKNLHDNVKVSCPVHGDFEARAGHLLRGHGCSGCADYGFKKHQPAYFYINSVGKSYLKFGITNNVILRESTQNRKSKYTVANLFSVLLERGSYAKDLESFIKSKVPCGVAKKSEMLDGYTETTDISELSNIEDLILEFFTKGV